MGCPKNLVRSTLEAKEKSLLKDYSKVRNHSEETSQAIDKEVHSLITSAYSKAITILQSNIDILHKVATILLGKKH